MNSTGLSEQKLTVLSSVYVSCLSFSLIGSCSIVVVSVVKRRRLNEQAKPLFQLALADFLASLFLMTATVMNFLSYNAVPQSMVLCSDGLPLSLTFYCISIFLVIIYARESAYAAQGWREQAEEVCRDQRVPAEPVPTPALPKIWHPLTGVQLFLLKRLGRRWMTNLLYISAWLLPLMGYVIYIRTISLTAVPLLPTQSHNLMQEGSGWANARFCNSCILFLHLHIEDNFCVTVDPQHNNFIRGFTFASVLAVLICSSLVYWKLQSWYRHYELVNLRSTGRVWSSAAYMILVIIFCWTPALILISLSFVLSETERLFPLFIIQAMSVSLQGFLNSIVYGWRRRNFREAVLGERLALLAYSNRAFFDQSLVVERGTE